MSEKTRVLEAWGYTKGAEGTDMGGAFFQIPAVVLLWRDQVIIVEIRGAGNASLDWDDNTQAIWAALKSTGGGVDLQDKQASVTHTQIRTNEIERIEFSPCQGDERGSIRFFKKGAPKEDKKWYQKVVADVGRMLSQFTSPEIEFTPDQQATFEEIRRLASQGSGIACPNCGKLAKEGATFCPNCGQNLAQAEAARGNQCKGCGASLEAGAKFCAKCGTRVETIG